jgi:hypothetical protein
MSYEREGFYQHPPGLSCRGENVTQNHRILGAVGAALTFVGGAVAGSALLSGNVVVAGAGVLVGIAGGAFNTAYLFLHDHPTA